MTNAQIARYVIGRIAQVAAILAVLWLFEQLVLWTADVGQHLLKGAHP